MEARKADRAGHCRLQHKGRGEMGGEGSCGAPEATTAPLPSDLNCTLSPAMKGRVVYCSSSSAAICRHAHDCNSSKT